MGDGVEACDFEREGITREAESFSSSTSVRMSATNGWKDRTEDQAKRRRIYRQVQGTASGQRLPTDRRGELPSDELTSSRLPHSAGSGIVRDDTSALWIQDVSVRRTNSVLTRKLTRR